MFTSEKENQLSSEERKFLRPLQFSLSTTGCAIAKVVVGLVLSLMVGKW